MSVSPWFYIEVTNVATGEWEKLDIYTKNRKGEFVPVSLWDWNGTHDLFSVLGLEESYDFPEFSAVHNGFPVNASKEVKDLYEASAFTWGEGEKSYPTAIYFNMADAKLYLSENPKVLDADAMEEYWIKNEDLPYEEVPEKWRDNPLKLLTDRVKIFLEILDDFWMFDNSWSDVRVICWLTH